MRTTSPIANLFGRSPIKPLQEHMKAVRQCASEVIPLFQALLDGDQERVQAHKERIFELEQEADDLKNDIRSHLPKSLFMPMDRRDFLDMLNAQDSIADSAQDIAGYLVLRGMVIPEQMRVSLIPYVERSVDAVLQCDKIINELDELLTTSFRGRSADQVFEMIDVLGKLETEGDDMGMELTQVLFEHEAELSPVSVFLWLEILKEIGDLADFAEDVGDRLRLLIAR